MSPRSIVGRLTLMFAVAIALVTSLAGAAIYTVQTVELKRHQAAELRARFDLVETMTARLGDPARWHLFQDKLSSFTPADGSVRYLIESPDPRFGYGEPWPADARVTGPLSGFGAVDVGARHFLTLSHIVPPFDERPAVRLIIAADTSAFDNSGLILGLGVLAVSVTTVVVVAILGRRIARHGLAPVDGLSADAAALNPQDPGLRLNARNLPTELDGLVQAFNGALDRLQVAYERLSTFNADVAHELRTPLSNLIGQTQVTLSRSRSTDELEDVLHSNLEELERLRRIINDMLFLARADQGAVAEDLSPHSLALLTRKSAEFLDVLFDEAGVTLSIEGDATAPVEPALLARAITNLLDNALRHGEPRGGVVVSIAEADDQVRLEVRNDGAAIAPDHLPRLFDRFYRPDAARPNSQEVHGLGLAVVKAVALMHGGGTFARCENGQVVIGFSIRRAGRPQAIVGLAPQETTAEIRAAAAA